MVNRSDESQAGRRDASLHELVRRQVRARPDAIAVVHGSERLSYAELGRRADRVAAHLRHSGVRPGDLVAIGLDRSIDMVVGLLGILEAGAAYLPLDIAYPAERLAFILGDAAPAVAVTTSRCVERLPLGAVRAVLLDSGDEIAVDRPNAEPPGQDALAYVIYTSGSTGQPKGCQISHANVVRLFSSTQPWFDFGPGDVWTFFHSHAFDFSVWEIWGALVHGGTVVVVPYEVSRSPSDFLQLLARERVTVLNQTPSAFRALIAALQDADVAPALALRYVIFGGEALELQMLRPWFERYGDRCPTLVNMYGITETTVHVTYRPIAGADLAAGKGSVIGRPIPDLEIQLLDERLHPVDDGEIGEMFVGGAGVCRGYLNRPELTASRFVDWTPSDGTAPRRLYRSGDLARRLPDGDIEYLGRIDHQVKVRGFRIETGEIESQLVRYPGVRECAVIARRDSGDDAARLVAYVVPSGVAERSDLRAYLARRLPDFMIPSAVVGLDALPLTENGKLDRSALPAPPRCRPALRTAYRAPVDDIESKVCDSFAALLGLDHVGADDNFFDLGGTSLSAVRAAAALSAALATPVSVPTIFARPTASGLARIRRGSAESALPQRAADGSREPVAIISMAGRFPGAADVEALWQLLVEGRDGVTHFAADALDASVSRSLRDDPDYVRARGIVDGVDEFDAEFFGIGRREAEVTDPQQRLLLEVAWECLERAGYSPRTTKGPVGVFAGAYSTSYFEHVLLQRLDAIERVGAFQVMLANDKDFTATRVAHRLDLHGPAVSVQTACSTSLVAIVQAIDALRAGHCRMALAGGTAVTSPPRCGYLHQDGAMLSPDGRTRTFDADARGTVFSDGVALVMLKRLSDALADGDPVVAVIRGAAINNDGGNKASFTAPSVEGQASVIAAALADAGTEPRSIDYVEAHGTATPLGDPVEIEGLARAFRRGTSDIGFCRVGSIKSNIGHVVAAAGAAGVIKVALALECEQLPPTIHFKAPNPKIDFAGSPFIVNDRLTPWPRGARPRRAGVSSFGVGGTNAHVVLEEAPVAEPSTPARGPQLLLLSARTRPALEAMAMRLGDRLVVDPSVNIADVAHTLQVGRSRFAHRLCVVADCAERAVVALRTADAPMRALREVGTAAPAPVWLFPGQGAQYAGMGRGLYEVDAVFREAFDTCCAALDAVIDFDLKARVFGDDADALVATATTQPATFCLEFALAQSWLARGLEPTALIGHSVGEFVAAALAGVMSPVDAVRLVAQRGALMQALPAGSMLTVRLSADQVLSRLPQALSLAAENGPTACVVAGPAGEVEAWRAELERDGIVARLLQTSHAFHSAMMDPAVEPFEALVRHVPLSTPRRLIVSTLTGARLTDDEATDPRYWARHLRETVRFSPAIRAALAAQPDAVFVEVGPRGTLSTLARQHRSARGTSPVAIASLADTPETEMSSLMLAVGQLWTVGWEPPVSVAVPSEGRRRLRLPTYPFERKRHWVDAAPVGRVEPAPVAPPPSTPSVRPVADSNQTVPSTAMSTATPSVSRLPRLVERLRQLFEDVAGTELGGIDPSTGFVELGLDSLTLTQAALQVKKHFGVPLTFRQLMESYRSLASLGEFLDATLPPELAQPPSTTAVPVAAAALIPTAAVSLPGASVDQPLLQQVIQQQMQLMAQQLALLGGASTVAIAAPPTVEPMTPAAAPPAATAAVPAGEDGGVVRYDVKKAFGAIARIHTQASELTERQQARLQAFVRRYVERTRRSKDYTTAHRPHLADPRVVNGFRPMTKEIVYQIVVERSKGARLWDIDGNEYVDVLSGFGMNLFGWQPDFVQEAVRRQLDAGYEIGPQHPLAGEVAALVCELTGFDRAGLCNTGSEAVMAAVRIARTVTGRSTVVVFTGSYHGTFDEVVVRAGRGGKGIPAAPGIMSGMFGDVRVLDYGTPEALDFIRANADDLAAVLVEPVQSRRPDFQPKEFLKEVRAVTEQSGVCLIFDEVITGFRSQLGGAQAHYGIRADLASYGKVIGGGFPVGVIAGKREYMDALDGGPWTYGDDSMPTVGVTYFAGTFVRHPLALAAAKASLLHLKQQGPALQTQLNLHTAAMADELTAFCREVGAPIEIRYFSSVWRVTWLEDHPLQDLLFAMMRSRGVHILDNFPCFLTTAHTPQDIAAVKSAFRESVLELQEAEFLPRRAAEPATAADPSRPPVPNAKLGRDKDGRPTWFVPDPAVPGKYKKVNA